VSCNTLGAFFMERKYVTTQRSVNEIPVHIVGVYIEEVQFFQETQTLCG
jgi:hypothetical protein